MQLIAIGDRPVLSVLRGEFLLVYNMCDPLGEINLIPTQRP